MCFLTSVSSNANMPYSFNTHIAFTLDVVRQAISERAFQMELRKVGFVETTSYAWTV